jgi:hypothetical protein
MSVEAGLLTAALAGINEHSLNVLLFLPAGLFAGLLPVASRRRLMVPALVLLPVAVEALQYALSAELGRSCQVQTAVENAIRALGGVVAAVLLRPLLGCVLAPARLDPSASTASSVWLTSAKPSLVAPASRSRTSSAIPALRRRRSAKVSRSSAVVASSGWVMRAVSTMCGADPNRPG